MVPPDNELIQQAQRGDMVAFEQLVRRYDQQVLSISATYVNDRDDAKDIYQEVFLRVFKGLRKFQFRSEFSTWLYRITTNVCLSFRARHRKHLHQSLDGEIETGDNRSAGVSQTVADGSAADEKLLRSDIRSHVERALDSLSPHQKLVFTLRHFQGYKLKEIASMMDCAEGTVKKYLFTATRRMREELVDVFN